MVVLRLREELHVFSQLPRVCCRQEYKLVQPEKRHSNQAYDVNASTRNLLRDILERGLNELSVVVYVNGGVII